MNVVAVRVCRCCRDLTKKAMPFNLNVRFTPMTGTKVVRGAGATELCEACWRMLTGGFPRRGGSPAL